MKKTKLVGQEERKYQMRSVINLQNDNSRLELTQGGPLSSITSVSYGTSSIKFLTLQGNEMRALSFA